MAGLLLAGPLPLPGQSSALDAYVAEGLRANLDLRRQRLALARAEAEVREANGRRLPSLTLTARYSERSGDILDIGSLVNPAFGALNQLLGRSAFPTDVSLKQPFKQETGLRLTQPIFEPAIGAGQAIARSVREGQQAATAGAARRLAAQIRLGYLDYARAARLEELRRSTLLLLQENLRVNQSLVANGVATPDASLRARADLSEGEQRLAEAGDLRAAARESFNLLLDRPLDGEVELLPDSLLGIELTVPLDSAIDTGLRGREELQQIAAGERVADGRQRLAKAAFQPSIGAAVDYGFQGDRYRFGADRDFAIASVVLRWNLFNGGQDRARIDQARLQGAELRAERGSTALQIALEIRTTWRAAQVAGQSMTTAGERLRAARRNYELMDRRYREGAAAQVELIDARTSYTSARLNQILTTYDYYARCVDLDRAAALYPADAPGEGSR